MTSIQFLEDSSKQPMARLLLAHGSGLPMDSPFIADITNRLVERRISVLRFEFPYMAQRRTGGLRRPPPRADKLCSFYREAIEQAREPRHAKVPLLIGGKSLGGRVASMIADAVYRAGAVQGLICLGYPFHPRGKQDSLRTAHLEQLACPTLVCQGTRDPLGSREEVAYYALSDQIGIAWLEDGNHDFAPRKRSGRTAEDNLDDAVDAIAAFAASLT